MNDIKKDIRQFESFEGRFMSIKVGISKSVLDAMTDEDRMTLGSMVSCFEGDMFGLLKGYGEIANASRITGEIDSETSEEAITENQLPESRSTAKTVKKG